MVVCQYFLRGYCKFGSECRNEHIKPGQGGQSGQSGQSAFGTTSAFGSIGQQSAFGGGRNGGSAFGMPSSFGGGNAANTSAFGNKSNVASTSELAKTYAGQVVLSSANMRDDLSPNNRPMWKISSYGPAKYEPNLITNVDVSLEEMRLRAYEAVKEGNITEYAHHEAVLASQADNTINQALSNIEAAYQQALKNTSALTGNTSQTSSTTAFGQPQSANAFQRDGAGASTFGAPSAFASPSTSAFGQSSAFGTPSAFGNTPANAGNGGGGFAAFGNNNTPARPGFGAASAFGSSATPVNAFGSTSAFGAATNAAAPPTAPIAFGAPSAFGNSPLTGSGSAFGQTSAPVSQTPQSSSAFGQTSTMNAFGATQSNSPFSTQPNPQPTSSIAFGNAPPAPSAFGSTSAFGQPAQASAFGSLSFSSTPAAPSKELVVDAWADETPKEESLPAEILAMFKAEQFEWGKVPGLEPPLSVR